jgi:hypothetical protein
LGGDYLSTIGWNLYTGDFCLALYATPLIHASWKQDFPDCHLITLSRLADYPYTILWIFLTPIDTNIPATMQTIYHTINHNL